MSRQTFSIIELLMLFLGICILCVSSFIAGFSISQETPTTSERELSNLQPIINLSCPETNISVFNTTTINTTYTHSLRIKRESEQCKDTRLSELRTVSLQGSSMVPEIYSWYSLLVKDFEKGLPLIEGDVIIYEFGINKKKYAHSVFGVYTDTVVLCPLPDVFSDFKECHNVPYKNIKSVVCGVLYGH